MNINYFEKFNVNIIKYQILYVSLIFVLIFILCFWLFFGKHIQSIELDGTISSNNIYFLNVDLMTKEKILLCKTVFIEEEKVNIKRVNVLNNDDFYDIYLYLNKNYKGSKQIKVKFLIKEEAMYHFIVNILKGDR